MSKKFIFVTLALIICAGLGGYFLIGKSKAPGQQNQVAASTPTDPSEFWSTRCEKDSKRCEIFQRLAMKQNNERVLEMAVGYPKPAEDPVAVVILPLGINVAAGIAVRIDEQTAEAKPIQTCNQGGCFSSFAITPALMASMKTGKDVIVRFMDGKGSTVDIKLSLQGFAQKLATVS